MSDAADTSARFLTRRSRLDKERALGTARNPGDSKYGNALYKYNAKENKMFSAEIHRIEKQLKRTSMHIDQEKKQFLQKHSQRDPMLIVVRPPSPLVLKKLMAQQYEADGSEYHSYTTPASQPRYMKPTKSMVKHTNLRPTIDAFCLKTKKKVNLWEEVILEKEKPSFRSTVMPSWPLTSSEVDDLVLGMEYHKNVSGSGHHGSHVPQPKALTPFEPPPGDQKKSAKRRAVKMTPPSAEIRKDGRSQWHFVTEVQPSVKTGEKASDSDGKVGTSSPSVTKDETGSVDLESPNRSICSQESSISHQSGPAVDQFDMNSHNTHRDSTMSVKPQKKKKTKHGKSKQQHAESPSQATRMARNNQTAICVIYNEQNSTNFTGQITKNLTKSSVEEPNKDADPDDLVPDGGKDITMENNGDTKDETTCDDDGGSVTRSHDSSIADSDQNRHKSGLEVILEAAIEGLDD